MSIQSMIDDAITSGQPVLVIDPGTYYISATLNIIGAHGLTIIADDVIFIMTVVTRVMNVGNCTNFTFQGLTINYDPLPFTQGVVTHVNYVTFPNTISVKLDQGYPVKANSRVAVFSPYTRKPKENSGANNGTSAAFDPADPHTVIVSGISPGIDVGDLVTLAGGQITPHSIQVYSSTNTTWLNITLHTSSGFGYIEDGPCGSLLDHFRIVPGWKPAGAIHPPLLSSIWDAMQFNNIEQGPTVRNCTIKNAGDDSFSIQTPTSMTVLNAGETSAYIAARTSTPPHLPAGDILCEFFDEPAIIVSVTHVAYGSFPIDPAIQFLIDHAAPGTAFDINKDLIYLIQFTAAIPFGAGDLVFNPRYCGTGFVYSNNTLYSKGRLLLKGINGLIENNRITGSIRPIVITPEGNGTSQAGCSQNLHISGNYISRAGYYISAYTTDQAAALTFSSYSVVEKKAFNHMVIENNTFDSNEGLNVQIVNCGDVQIRNNLFVNSHCNDNGTNGGMYNIDLSTDIFLYNSDTIEVTGNVTQHMGSHGSVPDVLSTSATNVTGLPGGAVLLSKTNPPIDPAKTYAIVNRGSGKALQTVLNGVSDNTNIEQETFNPAVLSQHWKLIPNGFYFNILHVASGKYMDITGSSLAAGADAVIFTANGSLSQQWAVFYSRVSFLKIKNVNSDMNLMLNGNANGVLCIQQIDNVAMTEEFQLTELV
ncbi:RICIN domain-containing protein [Paenibacillus pasadenensis]|uniref:RICIN domain-containing protein n=1 Tax=Paenibacillus pasadenensis TaxID=217090 RepID=UPI0020416392|nr:RICIN domain-containing protein [Paenibacillus pasadenensis]MCM3747860.1 RICIN domain-containing protein [Paenibacillus pasadenensis]